MASVEAAETLGAAVFATQTSFLADFRRRIVCEAAPLQGKLPGTPVVPGGCPIYQSVLNVARRYLQTRCEEGSELELHVQAAFAH